MSDKNTTERIGVNAIERAFLEMDWIFREQQISDYGIDAHAEPKDQGSPTGQLIAIQIKTGKSYFRKKGGNFIFYGERRHLEYWQNHILPVFIVLHDPESGLSIWQRVERNLITEHGDGRWSIEIPPHQILGANAERFLRHGISSDPASIRRFRLAMDLPLIKVIHDKSQVDIVFLRLVEWINKSLNFRESKFCFGNPDVEPEYTFNTWLPMSNANDVMNKYYPWLKYEYAGEIESSYGEIDEHIFEVSLNDLGESVLNIENFIEEGREPLDLEPMYEDSDDRIVGQDGFDEAEFRRILEKRIDD